MAITSFEQLQEKISALGLRVSVRRKGEALYLRAVLPPRPGSKSQQTEPHQQDLALKVQANRYGFEVTLEKAIAFGLALGRGEFNWNDYLEPIAPQLETVGEWVEKFKQHYYSTKIEGKTQEKTWQGHYMSAYSLLPPNESLSAVHCAALRRLGTSAIAIKSGQK